jgi:Tle cognate immunity protein 4 C-terminal domain/Tle cognate immunity protein 4 N-terminal domain
MTNLLRRKAAIAALLALCGCTTTFSGTQERTKVINMSQDNTPKKTHCLGRYLIDLNADVAVDADFVYAKGKVETRLNVAQSSFERTVSMREEKLKNTPHDKGGFMLVGRTELASNMVLIQSWTDSTTGKTIHVNESYIFLPEKKTLFLQSDQSDASSQKQSLDIARSIASDYRYRAPGEIPAGGGFCINSGLIASNQLNTEEVKAAFHFKQFPSVSVYLNSYVTGEPDKELLDRLGGLPASLAKAAAGMTSLRRGNRNLGMVKGQEFLVRADEGGKRSYEFLWESQGRARSVGYPFLSLKLTTTAETLNGQIIEAPFKTDEEALQFWDAMLQTLRLRPGAV